MNSIHRAQPSGEITEMTLGGKTYPVVRIGNLYWTAANLDYYDEDCGYIDTNIYPSINSTNATVVNNLKTMWTTSRACGHYQYAPQEYDEGYGILYNYAATAYINDTVLANSDWRVPTQADCINLIESVGGYEYAGQKLKSTTGWAASNNGVPYGTDEYGFNAKATGGRFGYDSNTNSSNRGKFSGVTEWSYIWCITRYPSDNNLRQVLSFSRNSNNCMLNNNYGYSTGDLDKGSPIRLCMNAV